MRLAILSDIHSNLQALEAVLATIKLRGADAIYCLGDIVGYGADPAECVDLVQAACDGVVRGNHDDAVSQRIGLQFLPKDGRAAARHNRSKLTPDQWAYLANLPLRLDVDGCTFVHASPAEPGSWLRLGSYNQVQGQFDAFEAAICFIGHTHIPAIMSDQIGVLTVRRGHRYLVNVGSVGQPRDHDPRAAVAFFDTDTFAYELVRVPYDVRQAAVRIREENLPLSLAERLFMGE